MSQRPGYHLAELNVGRLLAPTDDPRVGDFMAALDRINGLGKRMPESRPTCHNMGLHAIGLGEDALEGHRQSHWHPSSKIHEAGAENMP